MIFKKCEIVKLGIQLDIAQVDKYTYFDKKKILEKQIDSLQLEHILLLNFNNELITNINVTDDSKNTQIDNILKLVKHY